MRRDRAEFALVVLDELERWEREFPVDRPVWTPMLADRMGLNQFEANTLLWQILDNLAKRGLVERAQEPYLGPGAVFWRLTDRGHTGEVTVEDLLRPVPWLRPARPCAGSAGEPS